MAKLKNEKIFNEDIEKVYYVNNLGKADILKFRDYVDLSVCIFSKVANDDLINNIYVCALNLFDLKTNRNHSKSSITYQFKRSQFNNSNKWSEQLLLTFNKSLKSNNFIITMTLQDKKRIKNFLKILCFCIIIFSLQNQIDFMSLSKKFDNLETELVNVFLDENYLEILRMKIKKHPLRTVCASFIIDSFYSKSKLNSNKTLKTKKTKIELVINNLFFFKKFKIVEFILEMTSLLQKNYFDFGLKILEDDLTEKEILRWKPFLINIKNSNINTKKKLCLKYASLFEDNYDPKYFLKNNPMTVSFFIGLLGNNIEYTSMFSKENIDPYYFFIGCNIHLFRFYQTVYTKLILKRKKNEPPEKLFFKICLNYIKKTTENLFGFYDKSLTITKNKTKNYQNRNSFLSLRSIIQDAVIDQTYILKKIQYANNLEMNNLVNKFIFNQNKLNKVVNNYSSV